MGQWEDLKRKHPEEEVWDLGNRLITPGLVDPRTHMLFAGSREDELERKLKGESYEEITKKGGGIYKTEKQNKPQTENWHLFFEEELKRRRSLVQPQ